ncbi:MAG TPA: YdcF family protein [Thermohalobaculum sp.]|nr:YdcF family protein [Thermohalobaculum sp.]
MRVIARLLKRVMWLGVVVLALTVGAVLYFSDANLRLYGDGRGLEAPVDAILVLGGGVDGDGILGFSSRRRVAAAVALLKTGRARHLIFSGGPGWKHPDFTAAALMRNHAIELGAPSELLFTEDRSISTFENLRFGFDIAAQHGFADIALLTDAFHLERARRLAGYFGQTNAKLAAATGLEYAGMPDRIWSIVREAMAWWFNLAKVGGWEVLAATRMDIDARQDLIR